MLTEILVVADLATSVAFWIGVLGAELVHRLLIARGAAFLAPPVDHGSELRCFLRDPDGHLIELSQARR